MVFLVCGSVKAPRHSWLNVAGLLVSVTTPDVATHFSHTTLEAGLSSHRSYSVYSNAAIKLLSQNTHIYSDQS